VSFVTGEISQNHYPPNACATTTECIAPPRIRDKPYSREKPPASAGGRYDGSIRSVCYDFLHDCSDSGWN
jgi:hypothetical protein